MDALLNWIWSQQDYFWFLAGFAWLLVAVARVGRRRSADDADLPRWIPWSAVAGLLTTLIEFLLLTVAPVNLQRNVPLHLNGDLALGAVTAFQAAGLWYCGLHGRRSARWAVVAIGVLLAGSAVLRWNHWNAGNAAQALAVVLGTFVCWPVATASADRWKLALVAVALATLGGTAGLLASWEGDLRRWVELSPLGPGAAALQMVAAVLVWRALMHAADGSERSPEFRRDEHVFRLIVGGWLVAGLAFASIVGWQARAVFEQSVLARAQAAVDFMNLEPFEQALDGRFHVGEIKVQPDPAGSYSLTSQSPHLASTGPDAVRFLRRVARANPEALFVHLTTLRDGWLVRALTAGQLSGQGTFSLIRRAETTDLLSWAARTPFFTIPQLRDPSHWASASVPVITPTGRMLGWLKLSFPASRWEASQAQARALAYGIVGLGIILGGLARAHRRRERERDEARVSAQTAAAASEVKTAFLAKVSHELRTPLQSIVGYSDLLLAAAAPRERTRLLAMRQHAELMGRLVNDLIDLSAAECGAFRFVERPVAIGELVGQTVESFRPSAEAKGLDLLCRIDSRVPPWVRADPQRVRQVVINLVGNAVKYTDCGRVEIALRLTEAPDSSPTLEFSVTDTGPGIAPAEQGRLFTAFTRLELAGEKEGSGLGLAVAAAICRACGGGLRVESDGRSGSRFVGTFCFTPEAPPVAPTCGSLRGLRVLVADDNALVRDLFVAYLSDGGAVCAAAGDGTDALTRIRAEEFDAVVVDLAMPRTDGLAVVRAVRENPECRGLRIVGVSAHAGAGERQQALAAGMDAFLVKPVELPELARALVPTAEAPAPAPTMHRLRAQALRRFRAEAALQGSVVMDAWQRRDWGALESAAHYLKNSAFVVEDAELSAACALLQTAAAGRVAASVEEALAQCRRALGVWIAPAAN